MWTGLFKMTGLVARASKIHPIRVQTPLNRQKSVQSVSNPLNPCSTTLRKNPFKSAKSVASAFQSPLNRQKIRAIRVQSVKSVFPTPLNRQNPLNPKSKPMSTLEIIQELSDLKITASDEDTQLERIQTLTELLRQNPDGFMACRTLIDLLERHPEIEFGTPGEPVHTLEHFAGRYEVLLLESLKRRPTSMTIWMLNRMINAAVEPEKTQLWDALKSCITHPLADAQAKEDAAEFYAFQVEGM